MRKFAVLCLTLLLVMLNAGSVSGSDLVTDNSLSAPVQSSSDKPEKLAFGVKYALNNLPVDIYDYVPKDSMDMYLPLLESMTDSVYFTKRKPVEPERRRASGMERVETPAIGGGKFCAVIGHFNHKTSQSSIGISVGLSVSYTESVRNEFRFRDASLYIADVTAPVWVGKAFQVKNGNCRITDVYLDSSVGGASGGMACRFSARGEVHGELSVGSVTIYSGCLVDFESEGRACEYPEGSKYTSTFTPHF